MSSLVLGHDERIHYHNYLSWTRYRWLFTLTLLPVVGTILAPLLAWRAHRSSRLVVSSKRVRYATGLWRGQDREWRLSELSHVQADADWLEAKVGAGTIHAVDTNGEHVRLRGVPNAYGVAHLIRDQQKSETMEEQGRRQAVTSLAPDASVSNDRTSGFPSGGQS